MDFVLFLLLNAVLFVRPAEVVPQLLGKPIYEAVIIACLVVASPSVLRNLSLETLVVKPVSLCVVGIALAVVVSHVARYDFWSAREGGYDFAKIVAYYVLFAAVVTTRERLRAFLVALPLFTVAVTLLAVLAYHDIVTIPDLEPLTDTWTNKETGEDVVVYRMRSSGLFNDPNDLCLLLTTSMVLCVAHVTDGRRGVLRLVWLLPLAFFGYGLSLTQSRGGFLGLLIALLTLLFLRLGVKKSIPLAAVVVPLLFVVFGGRQTALDTSEGTGQDRIVLWAEGLTLFHEAPLFGIGRGEYAEQVGQVAHNSFVHAYVEMGVFGGTLFFGAFALALGSLIAVGRRDGPSLDPELKHLRPFVIAIVAGYVGGMLSLSRCYIVPTYMVLGLATAFSQVAAGRGPALVLSERLLLRLGAGSVATIALAEVYVRVFARFG